MLSNLITQLSDSHWGSVLFWLAIVILIAIAISLIEVIYRSRTPQSAMAWSMALIFMPIVGLLFYLLFGRRKFKGYIRARSLQKSEISDFAMQTLEAIYPHLSRQHGPPEPLEHILEMPFVRGNRLRLLINAEQTYEAILEAIASAKHYILLEYYIIRDDHVGQKLCKHLIEKAQQGVKIYCIYDEVGSWRLADGYKKALHDAGIQIRPFNTRKGISNPFQINFRNHRKLVVIDGHTAFAGGINIGKEYLGQHPRLKPWRDTHIKLQGPAVLCAQLVFAEDWYWASSEVIQLAWDVGQSYKHNIELLVMATGPADENLEACTQAFSYLFTQAKKRIWITTPYFIPNQIIMNGLHVAALSGIDVRVIMPKKADGLLVKLSAFSFVAEALKNRVKIYRYPGFLHQKIILIDDNIASVGSINLDNRSFSLNFEANILVRDQGFANEVAAMLEQDFSVSEKMSLEKENKRNVIIKFITKAVRLIAPIQ